MRPLRRRATQCGGRLSDGNAQDPNPSPNPNPNPNPNLNPNPNQVTLKIWHQPPDGPTLPQLRTAFLGGGTFTDTAEGLGTEGFPVSMIDGAFSRPARLTSVVVNGQSADSISAQLISESVAGLTNIFFVLDGIWAVV